MMGWACRKIWHGILGHHMADLHEMFLANHFYLRSSEYHAIGHSFGKQLFQPDQKQPLYYAHLGILGGASVDPGPRTVYPRFLSDPRPEKVAVKAPKPLGKQEAGDHEDLGWRHP